MEEYELNYEKKIKIQLNEIINKFSEYVDQTTPAFKLSDVIHFISDEFVINYSYSEDKVIDILDVINEHIKQYIMEYECKEGDPDIQEPNQLNKMIQMKEEEKEIPGLQKIDEFIQFTWDDKSLNDKINKYDDGKLYKLNNKILLLGLMKDTNVFNSNINMI